jgi:exonuclease VII large subunit
MPETVPTPDEVTADSAALAANAAERAQAAAADAIDKTQQAAAGLAVVAAEETRQSEERLAEWQSSLQQQHAKLSQDVTQQNEAIRAQLAETMDKLTSIQLRLDKPPESPTSPVQGSSDPQNPSQAPEPPKEPEAPPKVEKRKAHRWI